MRLNQSAERMLTGASMAEQKPAAPKRLQLSALYGQFFVYLLGNIGTRAVGFIMMPLYTRYLSPEEYGVIELIELSMQVVALVIGMNGIGVAMVRVCYDYTEEERRNEVVSSAFLTTLLLCALAALLGYPVAGWGSRHLFQTLRYSSLLRVSLLTLVTACPWEIFLIYLRMRRRAAGFVAYSTLQLIVVVSLNIYFIAFMKLGIWGFVLSKLITTSLGLALAGVVMAREVGVAWRWQPIRQMARMSAPMIFAAAGFFVIHFSDRFFLARYGTLYDVGIYALAYKFGFLLTYLAAEPFDKVWGATMFDYVHGPDWRKQVARALIYLLYILVLVALGIVVFSPVVLRVMVTSAFRQAGGLIPIIVLAYLMRQIGNFCQSLFYINKRVIAISMIVGIAAVLNLGLNFLLIGPFGMYGAAWATLVTWTFYMAVCWVWAQREHHIPVRAISIALLTVLAGALYAFTISMTGLSEVAQVGLDCSIVALYLALTWLFRYFPDQEKLAIKTAIAGVLEKCQSSVRQTFAWSR